MAGHVPRQIRGAEGRASFPYGSNAEDDTEECPGCGSKARADKLLKEGCSICGWVSPRLKREEVKV